MTLTTKPPTIECLEYRMEDQSCEYGRFNIGLVNHGQGITVGNTLRRALLSDLSGIAIVQAKILKCNDVDPKTIHEYSIIPGLKESVFELLLNLKEVILFSKSPLKGFELQKCLLKVNGPGVITATAIELPENLGIADRNHYIGTMLSPNCCLEIELLIEKGQGSALGKKRNTQVEENCLPVEANFMPIRRINYVVEEVETYLEFSQGISKERIILELWTDGSISPSGALEEAIRLTASLFASLLEIKPEVDRTILPDSVEVQPTVEQTLIEELGLSVRSYKCLKLAQIHTVGDLLDYSVDNLLELKNFGAKSAEEVVEALQNQLGIELPK